MTKTQMGASTREELVAFIEELEVAIVAEVDPAKLEKLEKQLEVANEILSTKVEVPPVETPVTPPVVVNKPRQLREPATRVVKGEILEVSSRVIDGRNTKIVTVAEVTGNGEPIPVFISEDFLSKSSKDDHLFVGNAITITLEDHIKDVTGFYDKTNGVTDEHLTAHTVTRKDVGVSTSIFGLSETQLRLLYKSIGFDATECADAIASVKDSRLAHMSNRGGSNAGAVRSFSGI